MDMVIAEDRGAEEVEGPEEPDNLSLLVRYFEEAEQSSAEARKLAERDRDYVDGKQFTDQELAALAKRGQPPLVTNLIQPKVNYLLGYEASQRQDPRAFPRTQQDESAAEAATDALRFVAQSTSLDQKFSNCWDELLVEGSESIEVGVDLTNPDDPRITVTILHWDRMFADPHAREPDYSDARFLGGVIWMDESEALAKWPDAGDAIASTISDTDQFAEDRPSHKRWVTGGDRKRVRIAQIWYQHQGDWWWCIFTKGGKIAGGPVELRDEQGETFLPVVFQSAFIDRENNRYGFVRALISLQDEINKRSSKLLHLLVSTPFLYESGAVASVDKAKAELAKPDGGIEVNHGFRFELLNNQLEMSGHFNLLREGKAQIENLGPNASLQGKGERSASGRAILANQQGGQIEIHRLLDRHNDFKRRVYQLIWQMVRLYWTDEKWVRVTDDEKNTRFVGLNRPVTLAEDLLTKAVASGRSEEEVKAQLAQMGEDPLNREELDRVVRVENIPAEMNMDIIIEEVPDVANIQDEQFQTLAKLAAAGISFPPEVYIKASGLRDKRDLLKFLEKQQENPAGLELQKLQVQKLAAEVEKLRAQVGGIRAESTRKLAEVDALDGRMDGRVTQPIVETPPPEADDLLNGAPPPEPPFPGSPQEASQELFTPTDL